MFLWKKLNDYLKSSRPLGKAINYTAPKRVIRLQGQLNIDAGLVNQKTATYVECINGICINDMRSGWLSSVPDE